METCVAWHPMAHFSALPKVGEPLHGEINDNPPALTVPDPPLRRLDAAPFCRVRTGSSGPPAMTRMVIGIALVSRSHRFEQNPIRGRLVIQL